MIAFLHDYQAFIILMVALFVPAFAVIGITSLVERAEQ